MKGTPHTRIRRLPLDQWSRSLTLPLPARPRTFMAGTNHVEVILPDGKRMHTMGVPLGTELVLDVDNQPAMDYDLLQLPPPG